VLGFQISFPLIGICASRSCLSRSFNQQRPRCFRASSRNIPPLAAVCSIVIYCIFPKQAVTTGNNPTGPTSSFIPRFLMAGVASFVYRRLDLFRGFANFRLRVSRIQFVTPRELLPLRNVFLSDSLTPSYLRNRSKCSDFFFTADFGTTKFLHSVTLTPHVSALEATVPIPISNFPPCRATAFTT